MKSFSRICVVSILLAIGSAQPFNHPQYGYHDNWSRSSAEVQQKNNWNIPQEHNWNIPQQHSLNIPQEHNWNIPQEHNLNIPQEHNWKIPHEHNWNTAQQYNPVHEYPKYQNHHQVTAPALAPLYLPEVNYPNQPYPVQGIASANSASSPQLVPEANTFPRVKTIYIPLESPAEYSLPVADHDSKNAKVIHKISTIDDDLPDIVREAVEKIRALRKHTHSEPDTVTPSTKHKHNKDAPKVAKVPEAPSTKGVSVKSIAVAKSDSTKAEAVAVASSSKDNTATTKAPVKVKPYKKDPVTLLLDSKENDSSLARSDTTAVSDENKTPYDDDTIVVVEDVTKTEEKKDVSKTDKMNQSVPDFIKDTNKPTTGNKGTASDDRDHNVATTPIGNAPVVVPVPNKDHNNPTVAKKGTTTDDNDPNVTTVLISNASVKPLSKKEDDKPIIVDKKTAIDDGDRIVPITGTAPIGNKPVVPVSTVPMALPNKDDNEPTVPNKGTTTDDGDHNVTTAPISSAPVVVPTTKKDDKNPTTPKKATAADDNIPTVTTAPISNDPIVPAPNKDDKYPTIPIIGFLSSLFDDFDHNEPTAKISNAPVVMPEPDKDGTGKRTGLEQQVYGTTAPTSSAPIVRASKKDDDNPLPIKSEKPPSDDDTKPIQDPLTITSEKPISPIGFLIFDNGIKEEDNVRKMFEEPKVRTLLHDIIPLFPEDNGETNKDLSTGDPNTTNLDTKPPRDDNTKPGVPTKPIQDPMPITSEKPISMIGFLISLFDNSIKGGDNVKKMFEEPKVRTFVHNIIPLFPEDNGNPAKV